MYVYCKMWWFALFLLLVRSLADTECPITHNPPLVHNVSSSNFRIVQYNVEWLFIDYYSPMNCPGTGCTWVNQSEAQIHMSYVSNVVKKLNPDILNLCEVEGCDELQTLVASLNDNTYSYYLKKGTDTSTGQNVGLITRADPLNDLARTESKISYPVPDSACGYTGTGGTAGVSKHYYTTYKWYGRNVLFIGLHLLAYPTDHTRCAEREAQAQVIQNLIMNFVPLGYEIMVLGDFNDFDAETLDSNNNVPLSHALDIIKGLRGTYSGKYTLTNAASKMPQSERWTDWWDQNGNCVSSPNEFSMIDHVLMTPFLVSKIKQVSVYHGYEEFCGKYNSDHYPVVIDMMYPY
jgi:exonuclease III